MAGTGVAIVTILEVLFPIFGIELPEGSIEAGVFGFGAGIGWLLLIWGQVRRRDLKFGIFRK